MSFTQNAKLTALSIVSVFETSRPLGDYAACVVLDDGAGVSYGICQFTHRSGSLLDVVEKYLALGGQVGRATLTLALPWLGKRTAYAINRLATSTQFKKSTNRRCGDSRDEGGAGARSVRALFATGDRDL